MSETLGRRSVRRDYRNIAGLKPDSKVNKMADEEAKSTKQGKGLGGKSTRTKAKSEGRGGRSPRWKRGAEVSL